MGLGVLVLMTTVAGSRAVTDSTVRSAPVYEATLPGTLRARWNENTMSSAVKGVPSCHLMSVRSLNSQVRSSRLFQLLARAGSSLPPSRELMIESQKCRASERSPAWLLSCGSSEDKGSA